MSSLKIGDSASISKLITDEDVRKFAALSLDSNPIHLDEEYARNSLFGRRIAHGLYVASFISATLASKLPGPGSIYLGQDLSFKKPVFIEDTVRAVVTVIEIVKPTLYRLKTECFNQNQELVVDGSALIKFSPSASSSRTERAG